MKKKYYVCILLHSEDQLILGSMKKKKILELYEIQKITNQKKNFVIILSLHCISSF